MPAQPPPHSRLPRERRVMKYGRLGGSLLSRALGQRWRVVSAKRRVPSREQGGEIFSLSMVLNDRYIQVSPPSHVARRGRNLACHLMEEGWLSGPGIHDSGMCPGYGSVGCVLPTGRLKLREASGQKKIQRLHSFQGRRKKDPWAYNTKLGSREATIG